MRRSRVAPVDTRRRAPWFVFVGLALAGLALALFLANRSSYSSGHRYTYDVGMPGPGAAAPAIRLEATDGRTFDLASRRGRNVLLYFQEGIGCQPCWQQITDLEHARASLRAAHVDDLVSITSNPLDALRQKVHDEGITTPVLSDPDLAVSRTYNANQYGMMGTSSNGHTFVLVGPDGRIRWRADYGGAPNYTMYVPVDRLLSDLRHGSQ